MTATLKKGIALLVVVFIGWLLVTDPAGTATLAKDLGGKSWELLTNLFEAISEFIGAIGK